MTNDLSSKNVRHGVMFEVPSACLEAEAILKEADFASIGSNDLIQYLFAVDRNNEQVAHDYNPDRAVFWDLLKKIVQAAHFYERPLSICGEMAGNEKLIEKIIKIGIDTVSVSPKLIPSVRKAAMAVKEE